MKLIIIIVIVVTILILCGLTLAMIQTYMEETNRYRDSDVQLNEGLRDHVDSGLIKLGTDLGAKSDTVYNSMPLRANAAARHDMLMERVDVLDDKITANGDEFASLAAKSDMVYNSMPIRKINEARYNTIMERVEAIEDKLNMGIKILDTAMSSNMVLGSSAKMPSNVKMLSNAKMPSNVKMLSNTKMPSNVKMLSNTKMPSNQATPVWAKMPIGLPSWAS